MHTAPYFSALGLLAIYLSSRVVWFRRSTRTSLGDGGHAELLRTSRAFGNFMEYVPFGLVLIFGLEYVQAPIWFLHLCGGSLLIGRTIHAVAFSKDPISLPARTAGMMLTYLSLLLGSIGLTVFSMLELHG